MLRRAFIPLALLLLSVSAFSAEKPGAEEKTFTGMVHKNGENRSNFKGMLKGANYNDFALHLDSSSIKKPGDPKILVLEASRAELSQLDKFCKSQTPVKITGTMKGPLLRVITVTVRKK